MNTLPLRNLTFVLYAIALGFVPSQLCAKVARVEISQVGTAWAGHSVGFSLLTDGDRQYVAYYDANRKMIVASRRTGANVWSQQTLPQTLGWDSHNYVTMGIDGDRHLHVSGNLHVNPLVYFRTQTAGDVSTLKVARMVGSHEDRVTYPRFFDGPDDALVFTYRHGSSGNGVNYYNVYDPVTKSWTRLWDEPLFNGLGAANAYQEGPRLGPDGNYHMAWVWRGTNAAETTHSVEYARSTDLVTWQAADGTPIAPPITPDRATLPTGWSQTDPTPDNALNIIVDPVPQQGGLINGSQHVGFDDQNRVVVSYHKFDAAGNTQIYNARFENGEWVHHQVSNWKHRWAFLGRGSLKSEVALSRVKTDSNGKLVQDFSHIVYGSKRWTLDPSTLQPIDLQSGPFDGQEYNAFRKVKNTFPGIRRRWANDLGSLDDPNIMYRLRWETLGRNRDQPRDPPWPEASTLHVYKFDYNTAAPLGDADPADVETLVAVEDAFVQLSSPNTNFGNGTELGLKFNGSSGSIRKIYLKFDLSHLDHDLCEASLVLDLISRTPGKYALSTKTFVLNLSPKNSWEEGTLAWNNAPAGDVFDRTQATQVDMLAALSKDIDAAGPLSCDHGFVMASGKKLVDAINNARANGEHYLTLVITRADQSGGNTIWASTEHASSKGPRLLLVPRNP